jgi:hypothetical protein
MPSFGEPQSGQQSLVEALRPFIGFWVAVRDNEVLVVAPNPKDVVLWLAQHGQHAQSMFQVTNCEHAVIGAADMPASDPSVSDSNG